MRWRRAHSCAACDAKDQTIALLADLVDWHRAQIGTSFQSATQVTQPVLPPADIREPSRMWLDEEEENLIAAVENGDMSVQEFESKLAAHQVTQPTLSIVR